MTNAKRRLVIVKRLKSDEASGLRCWMNMVANSTEFRSDSGKPISTGIRIGMTTMQGKAAIRVA